MADTDDSRPMRPRSTVERAYELARQGPSTSLEDIRRQLEREHYASVAAHLAGPTIRRELRLLCRNRMAAAKPAPVVTAEG